jgi:hypothetical protein
VISGFDEIRLDMFIRRVNIFPSGLGGRFRGGRRRSAGSIYALLRGLKPLIRQGLEYAIKNIKAALSEYFAARLFMLFLLDFMSE